jgi:hypothetical protein
MPLHLYKASGWKTLGESTIFQKEFRSSAATADEFRGTEVSVPAPCRDEEVPDCAVMMVPENLLACSK